MHYCGFYTFGNFSCDILCITIQITEVISVSGKRCFRSLVGALQQEKNLSKHDHSKLRSSRYVFMRRQDGKKEDFA